MDLTRVPPDSMVGLHSLINHYAMKYSILAVTGTVVGMTFVGCIFFYCYLRVQKKKIIWRRKDLNSPTDLPNLQASPPSAPLPSLLRTPPPPHNRPAFSPHPLPPPFPPAPSSPSPPLSSSCPLPSSLRSSPQARLFNSQPQPLPSPPQSSPSPPSPSVVPNGTKAKLGLT